MDKIGSETLKRMESVDFYNSRIFGLLKRLVHGEILEIGCGIGSFTEKLSTLGEVTAIDYDKFYIAKTKKRLGHLARVGLGDIEKGTYFFASDKKFDSIVCLNVLEHIKDDNKAIRNMHSLLKKNGFVFLLTPAHQLFFGKIDQGLGHYRRYSKISLSMLFKKCGFSIEEVYYFNALGGVGWFINSAILRRTILPSNQLKIFSILARPALLVEKIMKPPFGLSVCIVAKKT